MSGHQIGAMKSKTTAPAPARPLKKKVVGKLGKKAITPSPKALDAMARGPRTRTA